VKHIRVSTLAAVLFLTGLQLPCLAEDKAGPTNSTLSLQDQLNELRQGQQRILQEIAAIKSRLEAVPARSEFGAKPLMTNVISLNVHGESFRGDSQARVAIMEYSDFACSFCAHYAREIYPRIQENYVKTGKVRYYFRDLPAPEHTNSMLLARAARCAGAQGKFWEMHDQLFAMEGAHETVDIQARAEAIGLDMTGFTECLESERFADNIRRSVLSAKHIGIYGTPALIIGTVNETGDFLRSTKLMVGSESYESIGAAVDELLKAQPKE
jgi:protein-disulfide isomerase